MGLKDWKDSLKSCAEGLGDYELLTKTELANGYCDARKAEDKIKQSQYYAALMLRYWSKILGWKANSASLNLEDDDFVEWLYDATYVAFYYEAWRNPENPLHNDPNGVDKVINRCCFSQRGKAYQFHNKDKRKSNVQALSIDGAIEETGDYALQSLGCTNEGGEVNGVKELIKYYITKNKNIEALIIDGIVYGDSFKEGKVKAEKTIADYRGNEKVKTYSIPTSDFNLRKLVKHLAEIDESFILDYFSVEYDLPEEGSKAVFENLKKLSNVKIYTYIKKTLQEIKQSPNLLSYL